MHRYVRGAARTVGDKLQPFSEAVDRGASVGVRGAKVDHASHWGDAIEGGGEELAAEGLEDDVVPVEVGGRT